MVWRIEYSLNHLERVSTGIKDLDELLGGGLVKYSITLLAGNPGTGKTTIASHFIHEGLRNGEPCIYVSFSEIKNDYYKYMRSFGIEFEDYERKGLFRFIEAPTISDPDMLDEIVNFLDKTIRVMGAKRVVIDSVSALTNLIDPIKTRAFLHTVLARVLKKNRTTSIIIADIPFGREYVGYGVEEFIVDNVIITKLIAKRYYTVRVLSIRKMRGVSIRTIEVPFTIVEGRGIRLLPTKLTVPKNVTSRLERLRTGINDIDNTLDGGIPKGAQILITGPAGSGKITFMLTLLNNLVRRHGLRALITSFNEPEYIMRNRISRLGLEKYVSFAHMAPYIHNPVDMTLKIHDLVNDVDPDVIALYDLKTIFTMYEQSDSMLHVTILSQLFRSQGKIGIYVHTALYPNEKIPYDPIIDIIFNIIVGLKDGRLERRIYLWRNVYGRTMPDPIKSEAFSLEHKQGDMVSST